MAEQKVNPSNYMTDIVAFGFTQQLFEAKPNESGVLKYSACLMLDKTNKKEKARWDAAIKEAIEIGIAKRKFTRNQIPILKLPIRDGDQEIKVEKRKPGQGYEGRWFVNANSNAMTNPKPPAEPQPRKPPEIVKPMSGKAVPVDGPDDFPSGVLGRAIISFYPYDAGGSKGIAVGMNGAYKTGMGERLDGRVNVSSVFADYAESDSEAEGVDDTPDTDNSFG